MSEITLSLHVNGERMQIATEPAKTLLQMLRDDLSLLSVKEGCGQGDCGSCVVILNGQAVNACLALAAQVEDAQIITLEGLAQNGRASQDVRPSLLQTQFAQKWAFQCGFCTAGMLMSAYALLLNNPDPTREQIKTAIEGNLCRCTSYRAIIDAIQAAAGKEHPHE